MPHILHLTIKKKWFDMIASGIKQEEYREQKPYWEKRLFINGDSGQPRQFDIVRFRNGYGKNAPEMDVEWKGCWFGGGHYEWGAPSKTGYVIWLGKILAIKNYIQSPKNNQ